MSSSFSCTSCRLSCLFYCGVRHCPIMEGPSLTPPLAADDYRIGSPVLRYFPYSVMPLLTCSVLSFFSFVSGNNRQIFRDRAISLLLFVLLAAPAAGFFLYLNSFDSSFPHHAKCFYCNQFKNLSKHQGVVLHVRSNLQNRWLM